MCIRDRHIVGKNYKKQIPRNKEGDKIIHVNFAQIYPEDRGINYAVREGERIGRK
jgi:hypothetical protein